MHNEPASSVQPMTDGGPATWCLELASGALRSSRARAKMMGYEPHTVGESAKWWDQLLHPDERVAVHTARSRHLQGEGSGYRSEYRARRRDGSWVWLLEIGCIERDDHGHALRVGGVLLDITVEREEQFRQQQRLERLRTVFDYTYQFTALLSRDGLLLESNRTALKAAGASLSDAVGKPFWDTPFWINQPAAEIGRLRAGIARAAAGDFVRFQYQTMTAQAATRIVDFTLLPVLDDDGQVSSILSEGRDVTDIVSAHKALRTLEDRLAVATSSANLGLWDVNLQTGEAWLNDRWWSMLGYEPNELSRSYDVWRELLHPDDLLPALAMLQYRNGAHSEFRTEYRMRSRDGSWRWIHCCGRTVASNELGEPQRVAGVHLDVTERKEAEIRLVSAERLESVGKLAAGVAHEINTPVQFVNDSVYFIRDAVQELLRLTERLGALAGNDPANAAAVVTISSELPYFAEQLPRAVERSLDGLQRVAEIVRSMRELAHPDTPEMSEVDLNHVISNALVMTRAEYKYVAEVRTELSPLPPVRCHAGELNQVLLNLLVNAAHAITDVVGSSGCKGQITVSTRVDGDAVLISVADTGGGIPESIRHRIYEPFFTTKELGRGTGQGLAISHNIVVKRHGGSIDCDSQLGRGTVFHVRLPRHSQSDQHALSREQAA
ncbi:MAG TPA: PAS domain-containing protein [Steroidobacteraceae bacterium]|jgi:PAS domain S-box-containing protein